MRALRAPVRELGFLIADLAAVPVVAGAAVAHVWLHAHAVLLVASGRADGIAAVVVRVLRGIVTLFYT